MFLTVHATTGIIIGQYTGNIWLAFIAGFFSHFLLDIIPHGDSDLVSSSKLPITHKKIVKKIALWGLADLIIMTTLLIILYWQKIISPTLPILAGIAGGILPDFITGFYLLTKVSWLEKYRSFHHAFHFVLKKINISTIGGLLIQLAFFLFFLTLIIFI